MFHLLLQAVPSRDLKAEDRTYVILVGAVLMAVLLVGFLGIMVLRRRLAERPDESRESRENGGFTLADLRDLHAQGELTDDEFANAKAKLITRIKQIEQRRNKEAGESGGA